MWHADLGILKQAGHRDDLKRTRSDAVCSTDPHPLETSTQRRADPHHFRGRSKSGDSSILSQLVKTNDLIEDDEEPKVGVAENGLRRRRRGGVQKQMGSTRTSMATLM